MERHLRRAPLIISLTLAAGASLLAGCAVGRGAASPSGATTAVQASTSVAPSATSATPSLASTSAAAPPTPTAATLALTAQGAGSFVWDQAASRPAIEKLLGPAERTTDLTSCGLPGVAWVVWGGLAIGFQGERLFAWTASGGAAIPSAVALPSGPGLGDPLSAAAALPGAAEPWYDDVMNATSVIVTSTAGKGRLIYAAAGTGTSGPITSVAAPDSVECR